MKKIYKAELNTAVVYLVGEEDNTISMIFQTLEDATSYKNGKKVSSIATAVNTEVLAFGKTLGYITNKIEVE